ncbi:MAG: arginine--tRNA ligase [Candidatus Thermoplasmatota archaeon]|nr:arginine--tRNA ligase [Candidatus Thermoplasmatota archaeon]
MSEERDPLECFHEEIRTLLGGTEVRLIKAPEGKGDAAFACFPLAKQEKKDPAAIATELAERIMGKERKWVKECRSEGGYLNFFVDENCLARAVFDGVESKLFGRGQKKKEKVLLEHTSANPTGPLHVGRARNPIIGDTLARIMRFNGYDVTTEYYVDDAGMQVAMLAWGVKNCFEESREEKIDHRLVACYQQAAKLREENPEVDREIRELLERYEEGETEAVQEMEETYKKVLDGIVKSLGDINVYIDSFVKESTFLRSGEVGRVIGLLKPYAQVKDGALCIDLKPHPFFLTRSDGTTLYLTRDIAYHIDKFRRCDIAINILGEDHKLESEQLAIALRLLKQRAPEVIFYAFISLPEGKMSTRRKRVVYLDDLIDESIARAKEEVLKRRSDLDDEKLGRIARAVGIGAVRYNIIKVQASKPIKFRWEDALNMEGNSAPFLQYSYARARSILRKAGDLKKNVSVEIAEPEERKLALRIAELPQVVKGAAEQRAPHLLAEYLLALASDFNVFYTQCPVLKTRVKEQRVALVDAFAYVMKSGLELLGVEALEEM